MAEDSDDRTEDPTERRRTEAREKGNIARSTDLNAAVLMMAAATALSVLAIPLSMAMATLLRHYLSQPGWTSLDRGFVLQQFWFLGERLAAAALPVLLMMMGAALLANLVQVGFLLSPDVLMPKFGRINPLAGAKRILSIRSLVKLGVSLGKLILLTAIAAAFVAAHLPEYLPLTIAEPAQILLAIDDAVVDLAYQLAMALFVLAVLDFGFQKWKHEQELKMNKQVVRDEMKQMEGDPHIRHRRREAHRKLAQARELGAVKEADVVITNPTHIAVAIKYDPRKMAAPTVVAKGMGEIAAKIREIAEQHGIPIIERKPLARALYRDVKVGRPVPVEMYEVFVEVMAYVYRVSGRQPPTLA